MKSFRELRVWQAAMNLVEKIYRVTQRFPKQETYGLVSQLSEGCCFDTFQHCRRPYERTHQRIPSPPVDGSSFIG